MANQNTLKPLWDAYSQSMTKLSDMIDEINSGITDTRTAKAFKKLVDHFGKVVNQFNEIDKQIDPIAPITVKMPFEGPEFEDAWKMYKEALVEKHGVVLVSRQEEIRLRRFKRMSDNNLQRALAMLEFFIDNGYKGIFKPSEKQLTGDEPTKAEETVSSSISNKKGEQL